MKGPLGSEVLTVRLLEELLDRLESDVLVQPGPRGLSLWNKKGDYLGDICFKGRGNLVNRPK